MSNAAAAASTAHPEEDSDGEEAPKKSSGKLLYVLVGVNSLLVVGVLAAVLLRPAAAPAAAPGGHGAAAPAAGHGGGEAAAAPAAGHGEGGEADRPAAAPTAPSPTLPLGEFIVRLPSAEGDRYARFAFEASLGTQQQADMLKQQMPEIRDRFIGVLTDLSVDAVRGKAELDDLKRRLLKEVREVMPGNAVRSLYLTEFVLQ